MSEKMSAWDQRSYDQGYHQGREDMLAVVTDRLARTAAFATVDSTARVLRRIISDLVTDESNGPAVDNTEPVG